MHPQQYDLTTKTIFKELQIPLLQFITAQKIAKLHYLDIQFQTIESRRADLVAQATLHKKKVILHLEVQTDNDPDMLYRMLRYLVEIHQQYKLPIYQVVVFFGSDPITMQNTLCFDLAKESKIDYCYRLFDIKTIPFDTITAQSQPQFLTLLPLTQTDLEPQHHLEKSVQTLLERTQQMDFHTRQNLLLQSEILASLRYEKEMIQNIFQEAIKMLKVEETPFYQWVLEEGIEKGIEKGREEGIEKGREEGIEKGREEGIEKGIGKGKEEAFQRAILTILKKRFNTLPLKVMNQLKQVKDLDQLELAHANALDCTSLDEFLHTLV
jgi:predicted transposase/invertase (TIGR01784 family)